MSIQNALRQCQLMDGLSDVEISDLSKLFHVQDLKKGEIIFQEGTVNKELYIIKNGRVSVNMLSTLQNGEYEKIINLSDHKIFGEFSFLDEATRSATVIAEEDTSLVYIDNIDLLRFLEKNEHAGFIIMRNLAKILVAKLRVMNFELRDSLR